MMRAAIVLLALLAAGCTQLFLHPGHMQVLRPEKFGLRYEDVWLTAPDGKRLHGWHLRADGAPRGTVLHLHGNAENITTFIANVYWLPAAGYDVLLFDYRGYGRSEGVATIDSVHEDARLALGYLLERPAPRFVLGQSLGGSAAIYAVAGEPYRTRLSGIVTEGVYASYSRIAREKMNQLWLTWPFQWPLSFLFSDRYAAEDAVAQVAPVPLLIVHGEKDEVVPPAHARRLYAAAREPRELWIVPGSGHVNAFTSTAENREILLAFLARAAGAASAAPASPAGPPAPPRPKSS